MKKYVIVIALLVMLSVTMSATALMSKSINRENGVSAYAYWEKTSTDSYEYTNLGVMKTDRGTDISVYTCKYDLDWNGNCKYGYAYTTKDVFTVDKKLNSATLSTVNVDMYDWNTYEVITVPVQASWTGDGDLVRSIYRSISKSSDFTFKYSGNVLYRNAIATGTLDENDLGTSSYAEIDQFKNAYMSMEK
ncbi:MAG: hypothetical protein KKG76_00955 [Euryarchaeota archaeon]|nr:hypothetical protein [Euryarchaeota archaeon]